MELFNVVSIDETRDLIGRNFKYIMESEYISLTDALGRIVCGDIASETNVPHFRRSTVDGYAVRSCDTSGASDSMQAIFELKGEVVMGKEPSYSLTFPGECIYVPTGGMIPDGADSVVMIEYSDKLDDRTILINRPSSVGENVVQIGEDTKLGEVVLNDGTKIRPYEIGVLSSIGINSVRVYKRPKVGVISTGNEIVLPEEVPLPGEVRDINTNLVASLIFENGGEPIKYGVIKDDFEHLKNTVEKALDECDIVLVSGGSSVGKRDETLGVISSLKDSEILVHGISVKPGKPTIIGKAGGKAVYGLPGHPLACAVIFKTLVKYQMDLCRNHLDREYPVLCKFGTNYHKAKGREEYIPVTLERCDGEILANPVFGKSGLITSFSQAWGYVRGEKNIEGIREGQPVEVYRL